MVSRLNIWKVIKLRNYLSINIENYYWHSPVVEETRYGFLLDCIGAKARVVSHMKGLSQESRKLPVSETQLRKLAKIVTFEKWERETVLQWLKATTQNFFIAILLLKSL